MFGKIFVFSLAAVSFSAGAGTVNVGGGKGFVCRNSKGKIRSAHLLDLTEAEVQMGLTLAPMPVKLDDAINRVQDILHKQLRSVGNNTFFSGALRPLEIMRDKLHFLPDGYRPVPTDDSYEVIESKDCKVEQIARYLEDGSIQVDSEIWRALDARNQAALLLHEAIYLEYRRAGDTDSRNARRVVAYLFSTRSLQPVLDPAIEDRVGDIVCHTHWGANETEVFVRPGKPYSVAQFTKIEGRAVFARTEMPLPDDFLEAVEGRVIPGVGETHFLGGSFRVDIPLRNLNTSDFAIRAEPSLTHEFVQTYLSLYNSESESNPIDVNDPRVEKMQCSRLIAVKDGGWVLDYIRP